MIARRLLGFGLALCVALAPIVLIAQTRNVVDFIEIEGVLDPPVSAYLQRQIESAEQEAHLLVIRLDVAATLAVSTETLASRIRRARVPVAVWIAPQGASVTPALETVVESAHLTAAAPGVEADADFVAGAPSLYERLDGRRVELAKGPVVLETSRAEIRFHKMGIIERILHAALRPEVAYLFLLLGLCGLVFELYHPGIGAAAVLGAGSLALAVWALTILPVSWPGLALMLAGFGLLLTDLRSAGLGPATWGGTALFVAGSLLMFPAAEPFGLSWGAVAAATLSIFLFFIGVMTAAIRTRISKRIPDALIGATAVARTDIAPEGEVEAGGVTWRARTVAGAIPEGASVRIKGASGLVLTVEESS